jgi:hypothetical protein
MSKSLYFLCDVFAYFFSSLSFTSFKELRTAFEREAAKSKKDRLLLTMAVPAGKEYIDRGYDIPKLNK